MKFDQLYKLVINEGNEIEDGQELQQDATLEQDPTLGQDTDLSGGGEEIPPEEATPRNARIRNLMATYPKLDEAGAAKIVDADLYDTMMELKPEADVYASTQIEPEELTGTESSLTDDDMKDIQTGLGSERKLSELESDELSDFELDQEG